MTPKHFTPAEIIATLKEMKDHNKRMFLIEALESSNMQPEDKAKALRQAHMIHARWIAVDGGVSEYEQYMNDLIKHVGPKEKIFYEKMKNADLNLPIIQGLKIIMAAEVLDEGTKKEFGIFDKAPPKKEPGATQQSPYEFGVGEALRTAVAQYHAKKLSPSVGHSAEILKKGQECLRLLEALEKKVDESLQNYQKSPSKKLSTFKKPINMLEKYRKTVRTEISHLKNEIQFINLKMKVESKEASLMERIQYKIKK